MDYTTAGERAAERSSRAMNDRDYARAEDGRDHVRSKKATEHLLTMLGPNDLTMLGPRKRLSTCSGLST